MADAWSAGTWDGARRAQLERSLELSVVERLRGLEELSRTGDAVAGAGRRARSASDEEPGAVILEGSRPTPLASYLGALGVFRLVGEGADPTARGWWAGDRFHLRSSLDGEELVRFLLERYRPTPILAPWNGGSGFYPKDSTAAIEAIEGGGAERFAPLRHTISTGRTILEQQGLEKKPTAPQKEVLLTRLRGELDEASLAWLDAAILLTDENPRYPPLLGTGGNDGRLEFTNNFLQRLVELFDPETGEATERSEALLEAALFDSPSPEMRRSAVGQFDPSGTGGPNAASSFEGASLVNPWEYVLMLEGAVLFAAAATRRLESTGPGVLSYPFTVRPTGAGTGSADMSDEADARGEIWMPLWKRPASLPELRALLAEGRATVGRRAARDGLDFARAVARLGVARGVDSFQRFGFLQRYGRTFLATPLDRVHVRSDPRAELIDQLERRFDWLGRFRRLVRRDDAAARLEALGRVLDEALFGMTTGDVRSSSAPRDALVALGRVMQYMAKSSAARERCPPVPLLGADWVRAAYDGSAEFRLAAALAGLHGPSIGRREPARSRPMVEHVAPVSRANRWRWSDQAHHDVVWGQGGLEDNLRAVLERRLLDGDRGTTDRAPDDSQVDGSGQPDTFPLHPVLEVTAPDVAAFLAGRSDLRRIEELFLGLALTRIPRRLQGGRSMTGAGGPPATYRILKPFLTPSTTLARIGFLRPDERLPLSRELVRRLGSDDVEGAERLAVRRLKASGFRVAWHVVPEPGDRAVPRGRLLLASLLVPMQDRDLGLALRPLGRKEQGTNNPTSDHQEPKE